MRVDFGEKELPHEEQRTQSASSDVSSFGKLAAAAQQVRDECVKAKGLPGWVPEGECDLKLSVKEVHGRADFADGRMEAGDLRSIAVALWPTFSEVDNKHPSIALNGQATGQQCPIAAGIVETPSDKSFNERQ